MPGLDPGARTVPPAQAVPAPSKPAEPPFYWFLALAPLLVLAFFYLYPLVQVLLISVTEPRPGLGNYADVFASSGIHGIIGTTLRLCTVTTLVTLFLGYVLAYCILHAPPWARGPMLFVVLLSFWVSILIRAFAWIILLQNRGVLNGWAMQLHLIAAPVPLIRNAFSVSLGMVHYMIPYAVLPLLAGMRGIDPALVPAARGLGASPTASFLRIYLPASLPGLVGAGLLVFIFALGFYITPALLGGGRVTMLSEYIALQIRETLNWGVGTALASLLLLAVALLLALAGRVIGLRRLFGTP